MIACRDGEILRVTDASLLKKRLNPLSTEPNHLTIAQPSSLNDFRHPTGRDIVRGDARQVLRDIASQSVHLVITSPPYYNAKPEYTEYVSYEEYLRTLEDVFAQCHRVLAEGRFFIVNASPVLVRRASRNKSSKRIPVPFHINAIVERLGFDFIDDIIWVKPTGAGWNTGRGRRFAADRHPLQYKPVPVTEYFLVYRKHTDKLIDWNIRSHSDQGTVHASRIPDGYEVTNVWRERPANHSLHPAVFPESIIRKMIRYYSFLGDIVLDPFAGIGTVGHAAIKEGRGYYLIDNNEEYCRLMIKDLQSLG